MGQFLGTKNKIAVLLLLTLVTASVFGAVKKTVPPDKVPVLAVPRTSKPPVIDGTIGADEWKESVSISGVAHWQDNIFLPRPTSFFISWDPGHLYVACRVFVRKGVKPRAGGRSNGKVHAGDAGMELVVKPNGKNVHLNNSNAAFKFFVNSLGCTGDLTKINLGQFYKGWIPEFKTAARLTDHGTAPDGGRWLEIEMSATPKDFELTKDNAVDDEWKMMLAFNQLSNGWLQARIPCNGSFFECNGKGYCTLTLSENIPAVHFLMEDIPNLAVNGQAAMTISAFDANNAVKLDVDVNIGDKIVKKEVLNVPKDKVAEWKLTEKLPADNTEGEMNVAVKQGDKTLLSYFAYYNVGNMKQMLDPVKAADPSKFPFSGSFSPIKNCIQISADSYYLPVPQDARKFEYQVKSAADGRVLVKGEVKTSIDYYFSTVVELPDIKPGEYVAEGLLYMKDGKKLGPMTYTFAKKDEAKEFATWWNKDQVYGNAERVLPPYKAMTNNGSTVTCWNRSYELSALGLPKSIISANNAVTSAPARLVVIKDGKEIDIPLDNLHVSDFKQWRVSFSGTSKGAGLQFSAKGWVEQDGLVYVDLTYGPEGNTPVKIDGLRIEYNLNDSCSESLVCIGPGGNFSSYTSMLIPQGKNAKPGQFWSTFIPGRGGSWMTLGSFYPTVWIGSDQRGFMWWADNDKGWIPNNDVPAHEAIRTTHGIVLRNNIISKPVTLHKPRTISFSYNASPFRPLLKGWRTCDATEDGTFFQPHRNVRKDSKTDKKVNAGGTQQGWIHPESRYPEEWAELWKKQKTSQHEMKYEGADARVERLQWMDPYASRNGVVWNHMSFTLIGYGRRSIEDALYKYFGNDWDANFDKSWINYAMYLFYRAFTEGGVRSTYWDITFPNTYNSVLSGHAYRLDDGRIQPGFAGWNYRRFFMRLQAVSIDCGLFPFANGSHSTNGYVLVAMPWLDAVLDGERDWNVDLSDNDWVDYYPIERMRCMSSPHNWGTTICWMGNISSKDKNKITKTKRGQGMWVWMHDSWLNPYIPQLRQMPTSALDWGINQTDTEYIPYWRNPYVTSNDPDILVSAWKLKDRVMLGVFNYNRKSNKNVTLKVDLDKLNLIPKLQWQEFVGVRTLWVGDEKPEKMQEDAFERKTKATLDFHKRELKLNNLQPHTIRLIGIRLY